MASIPQVPVHNLTCSKFSCEKILWVRHLDNEVTESQLFEFFDQVAPVVSVSIRKYSTLIDGSAFGVVNFSNKEDAVKARDMLNSKCINGMPVHVMSAVKFGPGIGTTNGCANVFVKNLDATIDSESLRKAFSVCGTVLSCKVATDSMGRSKGYGYVQFKEEKDAQEAIGGFNKEKLGKKEIVVLPFIDKQVRDAMNEAKLRKTVYVKNVSEDVDYELFASVFRHKVRYACNTGSSSAPCTPFVTFETEEDAVRAVEKQNGYIHNGKTWHFERAWSEKLESKMKQGIGQVTNLYVKNIDKSLDDEKLEELFSQFGKITSCKVMLDSQGCSKGFGFVAFSSCEEASNAMKEMNGKTIGSNPKSLYVAIAQRKEDRKLMLQARFPKFKYQNTVTGIPPLGTSVSAPPYPVMPYHYQLGMGRWRGGYPQLMPSVELLHHNANQGYIPTVRSLHAPANYLGFGHYS